MAASTKPLSKLSVVRSHYSLISRKNLSEAILRYAQARKAGYVCVANVHTTMMGFFDPTYRRITNEAAYAVPDGMPLVWAMKSLGASDQDRARGPSLMAEMMDRGRALSLKHYLYGGSPAALRALQEAMERAYPGCQIVGAYSPPFRPLEEIPAADWESDAAKINQSGAQLIWVGLGAPKQERWMWEQRHRVEGLMLGVGAAFELLSGRIPEAPANLQKLGLEWAYRLYQEPRRLWRRYLFNNPAFLVLWGWQLLKAKFFRRNYYIPG